MEPPAWNVDWSRNHERGLKLTQGVQRGVSEVGPGLIRRAGARANDGRVVTRMRQGGCKDSEEAQGISEGGLCSNEGFPKAIEEGPRNHEEAPGH